MKSESNIPEETRAKLVTALEEDIGMLNRGLAMAEKLLYILGETWGIILKTEKYEEDMPSGFNNDSVN